MALKQFLESLNTGPPVRMVVVGGAWASEKADTASDDHMRQRCGSGSHAI